MSSFDTLKFISSSEVEAYLDYPSLIDRLDKAFRTGCNVPLRQKYELPGGRGGLMLIKPAWRQDGPILVKVINVFPGNKEENIPAVNGTVMLFDGKSGRPVATIDGQTITNRRTAASSALAGRFLAKKDASTHLVVGTGQLAFELARAYLFIRPIKKTLIWGRNKDKVSLFIKRLSDVGVVAAATENIQAAVEISDIVSCATLATEPLIFGDWLKPGVHLDLVGGYRPDMREADDVAITRCRIYVDTIDGALTEAGDLTQPIEKGLISPNALVGGLSDVCQGKVGGRQTTQECTLFKSVGTALEDLAAAELVWDRAQK